MYFGSGDKKYPGFFYILEMNQTIKRAITDCFADGCRCDECYLIGLLK